MNYIELHNATHKWAEDRGIVKNGKVFTQTMKLISEFGELCDGIIKDRPHEIKDAIGDMMVVISNIASIEGEEYRTKFINICQDEISPRLFEDAEDLDKTKKNNLVGMLCDLADFIEDYIFDGFQAVRKLKVIASLYKFTLAECWEAAYNEIKDRKGYLNEQGNFIKEGDV
ncbi:hypothetical protein [Methanobrevibacter sp.]|uniref:hypothetical protein n=1 Tax=Methanobrevibacter sp. TaxID=66852 RepID=UPI003D7ED830